jgi:type I restriction enzyme, S subunit
MGLLEQHFDVAFAAPDGIKKLRELILTLAMQGKLVPQDPKDEPASELLRSIELEKQRLVKEGKIKQSTPLQKIEAKEIPYKLPSTWEWCRWNDVALKIGDIDHKMPNEVDFGVPYVSPRDFFGKNEINFERAKKISTEDFEKLRLKIQPEKFDIIFPRYGTLGVNRFILVDINFLASYSCAIIKNLERFIDPTYSYYYSISPLVRSEIERYTKQTTQANVGVKSIQIFLYPLPSLAEQRRIVAKIDQLMARCDELEKLRVDRSQRLLTVHTAALDRLLTAKDSSEFSTAWSFITQHFGELYSVKENVVELRKTILQLAVMGKLVRQDPNDEPASELLRSIELEKQRLVKEGKIKQSKLVPEIEREEIPYELPKEWVWARLGEISLFSDSGWSPQCLSEPRSGQEWGVLKVSAVSWGEFRHEENKALPPGIEAKPECEVQVGDFLISRANTEELVARSVLVKESPVRLMMSDKIVRFKLSQKIEGDFINFANLSRFSREYYSGNASGTSSSMKNVSREVMNNLPIPLPPLAEQRRIVEKIDRLMGMCDRLEGSIESGKGKQTDLLNALMSQV